MHFECYHPVAGYLLRSLTDHFAEAEVFKKVLRQIWNSCMQGRKFYCIFLTGGNEQLGDGSVAGLLQLSGSRHLEGGQKGEKHLEMAHA